MKQIRKFLGVFLALAMVVGMVGMMPVVEAKAGEIDTVTVVKPTVGSGKTEVKVVLADGIYNNTVTADKFPEVKKNTDTTLSVNGVSYDSSSKTVTLTVSPYDIIEGDTISVKLLVGGGGNSNAIWASNNSDSYGEGPYTSEEAVGSSSTVTEGDAGVGLKVADAISFDYDTSVLTIADIADDEGGSSNESTVVYVAFGKTATLDATAIAKLKYDAYLFPGEISLNLSAISPKKDSFIYLYTDAYKKVVQFTIAKNDAKAKIVFDFSKTKLNEVISDKNGAVDLKNLEVRTPLGWESVEEHFSDSEETANIDISQLDYYTAYGTTLYFRAKGANTNNGDGAEGASLPVQFASAEFKVKVPKKAAAPKVTLDGAKEIVKYGKGLEILADDGITWKPLAENGTTVEMKNLISTATDSEKLFGNKADGIYAIVRTKGTDKKPASKVAVVSLKGEATDVNVNKILGLDGATPSVEIVVTPNTNKTTKSIVVNNTSDYEIEFYVGAADATGPTGKWTKIKAGKEGKVAKADAVVGKVIFIRLASVKDAVTKINSIPSVQVKLGDCPVWVLTAPTEAPAAPALAASVATGTTTGTKLTITDTVGAGNKFVYKVSTTEIAVPKVGDAVSGTIDITGTAADDIAAAVDQYIVVYEVNADGKVVKFKSFKLATADIKA